MSKTILVTILTFLFVAFGYFTFFAAEGPSETFFNPATRQESSSEVDNSIANQETTFYDNGDDVFCSVGSGAVESIYYFSNGQLRVSGAINGQEVNSIYKNDTVYTWSVQDGEIISPLSYVGPNARQDNLLAFGPADYDIDCTPWLEVDKSVFELPNANFEVINN